MLIEMSVGGLSIDPFTNMPFMVLKDHDDKQKLPIWIGLFEASAIATELEKIKLSRPMTHDLIRLMLTSLNCSIKQVEIYDLKDNTFYARIILVHSGGETVVDSRPSDAIAIALRMQTKIFVEQAVIEKARKVDLNSPQLNDKDKVSKEKWKEILESLAPEDFGKYKM